MQVTATTITSARQGSCTPQNTSASGARMQVVPVRMALLAVRPSVESSGVNYTAPGASLAEADVTEGIVTFRIEPPVEPVDMLACRIEPPVEPVDMLACVSLPPTREVAYRRAPLAKRARAGGISKAAPIVTVCYVGLRSLELLMPTFRAEIAVYDFSKLLVPNPKVKVVSASRDDLGTHVWTYLDSTDRKDRSSVYEAELLVMAKYPDVPLDFHTVMVGGRSKPFPTEGAICLYKH